MQKLHSEPGPHLILFSTRYDQVRNPRNGLTHTVVVLEGNDAAQVVALTPDDKILLVRQYRFGIGDYTLELPGGMIDTGETPRSRRPPRAARRNRPRSRALAVLGQEPLQPRIHVGIRTPLCGVGVSVGGRARPRLRRGHPTGGHRPQRSAPPPAGRGVPASAHGVRFVGVLCGWYLKNSFLGDGK